MYCLGLAKAKKQRLRMAGRLLCLVLALGQLFPKEALASRSSSRGDLAEFDAGKVAINVGVAIACAYVGTYLSSLVGIGDGSFSVANAYQGYVAGSQASRAVNNAGQYYNWGAADTYLLSSVVGGLAGGVAGGAASSGGSILVGGASGLAQAGTVVLLERDALNRGESPSVGAQIAGYTAGFVTSLIAQKALNSETYKGKEEAKATQKTDSSVIGLENSKVSLTQTTDSSDISLGGGDTSKYHLNHSELQNDSASSLQTTEGSSSSNYDSTAGQNGNYHLDSKLQVNSDYSSSSKIGLENSKVSLTQTTDSSDISLGGGDTSKYHLNHSELQVNSDYSSSSPGVPAADPRNFDLRGWAQDNLALLKSPTYTLSYPDGSCPGTMTDAELGRLFPVSDPNKPYDPSKPYELREVSKDTSVIFNKETPIPLKTVLTRLFVEPTVQAFSSRNWPDLASHIVVILLNEEIKRHQENADWQPFVETLVQSGSQAVFSQLANTAGLSLDLYVGKDYQKYAARQRQEHYVKDMAVSWKVNNNEGMQAAVGEANLGERLKEINNAGNEADKNHLIKELQEGLNNKSIICEKENKKIDFYLYFNKSDLDKPEVAKEVAKALTGKENLSDEQMKMVLGELKGLDNNKLWEVNRNLILSQEARRVAEKMQGQELSEALGAIGANRFNLALGNVLSGLPANIFNSAVGWGTGVAIEKLVRPTDNFDKQMLVPYAVGMLAGGLRGAAWYLGWDYASQHYQWHPSGMPQQEFYFAPQEYTKKPGDDGYDFFADHAAAKQYPQELASFSTLINDNRLEKHILVFKKQDGKDVSGVHLLFSEEKPALGKAIVAGLAQAHSDYIHNTFNFGRLPEDIKKASAAELMDTFEHMRNVSRMRVQDALLYNANFSSNSGFKAAFGKSVSSAFLQIPYAADVFRMQPERLAYMVPGKEKIQPYSEEKTICQSELMEALKNNNGEILTNEKQEETVENYAESTRKKTEEKPNYVGFLGKVPLTIFGINTAGYDLGLGKYYVERDGLPFGAEGGLRITSGVGYEKDPKTGVILEEKPVGPYILKNIEEIFPSPSSPSPLFINNKAEPPGVSLYNLLPKPGILDGRSGEFSYVNTRNWQCNWEREEGMERFVVRDTANQRLILQQLSVGGGLLHSHITWWNISDPHYNVRPQTGPTTYLKIGNILPALNILEIRTPQLPATNNNNAYPINYSPPKPKDDRNNKILEGKMGSNSYF